MSLRADLPAVEVVEKLYDENRFLEAYELTKPYWSQPEIVPELTARELLIGSRLAFRLGSGKYARALGREANRREPDNPYVRYFAGIRYNPKITLLDILVEFERAPELDTDDPVLQASWLSSQALYWAQVRDFQRAKQLLGRAEELNSDHAWVSSCKANVLLAADEWDEAEACAEAAWERSPGMPAVANALVVVLSRKGRVMEAAERLGALAADSQSYEVCTMAAWYACAASERSWPDGAAWLQKADVIAEKLPTLAPIADRDALQGIAHVRLDVALTGDNPDTALSRAEETNWPFAQEIAKSLRERKRDGKLHMSAFKTVYQKHDTCLPASMATILGGMGDEVDEDEIATAITYGGTPIWKAVDWLRERDWHVRQCLLSPDLARQLLKAGFPFVFLMEWDEAAHATAAIGYDESADLMIVHDPSRTRWSRYVVDKIGEAETPIGPEALLVCRPERQAELDEIVKDDPLAVARRSFFRMMDRNGAKPALKALPKLAGDQQEHPIPTYLRAIGRANVGEPRLAIEDLLNLFRDHPKCALIRRSIVGTLYQTGNTGYLRETLREIVEAGRMPGIADQQTWRYPPGRYVCQYADILGLSAEHFQQAERLVIGVIDREGSNPIAWHVLGDLRFRLNQLSDCELPYRIASYLARESTHYARACADLRHRIGDTEGAVSFLRERADALGEKEAGADAWTALVDALEEYGMPAEADKWLKVACKRHGTSPELMHYAMHFCIRMGRWHDAEYWLRTLEETDHELLALSGATAFFELRGDWRTAYSHCRQWLDAAPEDMVARRALIRQVINDEGYAAAVSLAEQWSEIHPDDENYEELLFEQLPYVSRAHEIVPIIEARVKRNPDDGWAWRELVIRLLTESDQVPQDSRAPIRKQLDEALKACQRTCPDHEITLLLRSRIAQADGDYEEAVALGFASLRQDPANGQAYRRIWTVLPRLSEERQTEVREKMEEALMRVVGNLYPARDLAFMIAAQDGLSAGLAALDRWQAERPDDPVFAETRADLLLDYGQGRSDAEKAAKLLEASIKRFPTIAGLRQSLARAYNLLLEEDKEIAVTKDFLERYPANVLMRMQLADLHRRRGEPELAVTLLDKAIAISPRTPSVRDAKARFLWLTGDPEGAVATLREAIEAIPESVNLLETLADCLFDLGKPAEAVAVARGGVENRPENSALWLNLARTLERSPLDSDFPEIEAAYQKALELDASNFDAADELACQYVVRRQFQDATTLLEPIIDELPDATAVHGRMAWTTRMEGKKEDARKEMEKLLEQSPWYVWGWGQLLDWLEEDEDWSEARRTLQDWPEVLADNVDLRSRRLLVLESAKARSDLIEDEWMQLVADFPRSIAVSMRRFDRLLDDDREKEAKELLDKVEGFHPREGHVMARRAQMMVRDKNLDGALRKAEEVWFLPDTDNAGPEYRTWRAFSEAGRADHLVDRVERLLQQGRLPGITVFRASLEHVSRGNEQGFWPVKAWESGVKRIRKWQRYLDAIDEEAGDHRAATLSALTDVAAAKLAVKYWRGLDEMRQRHVAVWQQAAHAMLNVDPGKARMMLADWREFGGVEMFIVCNHVLACLRSTKDMDEVKASASDALAGLPHDWTARYLATAAAHAALRQRNFQDFVAIWDQWHPYLDAPDVDGRFYANDWMKEQLPFLSLCRRLLASENLAADLPELQSEAKRLLTTLNSLDWGLGVWPELVGACDTACRPGGFTRALWTLTHFFRANGTTP